MRAGGHHRTRPAANRPQPVADGRAVESTGGLRRERQDHRSIVGLLDIGEHRQRAMLLDIGRLPRGGRYAFRRGRWPGAVHIAEAGTTNGSHQACALGGVAKGEAVVKAVVDCLAHHSQRRHFKGDNHQRLRTPARGLAQLGQKAGLAALNRNRLDRALPSALESIGESPPPRIVNE